MKYKPIEPSAELLRELCCNIGEDMKYVLAEICRHNSYYPKNKITIDYTNGSTEVEINDENENGEVTFVESIEADDLQKYDACKYIKGFILGYSNGLNAAGVRTITPKDL